MIILCFTTKLTLLCLLVTQHQAQQAVQACNAHHDAEVCEVIVKDKKVYIEQKK